MPAKLIAARRFNTFSFASLGANAAAGATGLDKRPLSNFGCTPVCFALEINMKKFLPAVLILIACAGQADATARIFFRPEHDGAKLALCEATTAICGKAIADAFCTALGFSEAILFEREVLLPSTAPTFRRIKCYVQDKVALN
jgi:hypothetical protein